MPEWFKDNRDFGNIEQGLLEAGFSAEDTAKSWVTTGCVSSTKTSDQTIKSDGRLFA
jgi:hypothetical protein